MSAVTAALPFLRSLEQCSSFKDTVTPFWPHVTQLPQRLLDAYPDQKDLIWVYKSTNPLAFAFAFSLFLSPIFLIVSEVNRNYSQVDRCWSILPPLYTVHYVVWAHMNNLPTVRLDNILGLVLLWGLRLTFNYWRKGGYSIGSEDYRWEILQKYIKPWPLWFAFNVVFISLIQSILLFSITTPVYVFVLASRSGAPGMHTADNYFARTMLTIIVTEWFADQQQWNFQNAKRQYQQTAKVPKNWDRDDLDRGFCTTGLWRWSRHPNFACEQLFWVSLCWWSAYQTNHWINWTAGGAFGYLCLFRASGIFQESITVKKYTEYRDYQRRVSMFLPKIQTVFTGPVASKAPKVNKPEKPEAKAAEEKKAEAKMRLR